MKRWPLFVALFVVAFLMDFFLLLIIWEELGGQPGVHFDHQFLVQMLNHDMA